MCKLTQENSEATADGCFFEIVVQDLHSESEQATAERGKGSKTYIWK